MWMGQTSMYMKKQMILVTLLLFLFFRENAKALRFDALIEKKGYMYKSSRGLTPRHTTRPKKKKANLGE
jgi:hypothetical protein